MFNYNFFKERIEKQGYKVRKNGKYITVTVEKGGFRYRDEPIGEWGGLQFVSWEHCNDYIFWIRYKIVD